ncbi:hypothetical protein PIB30_001554 [Stylosanthes scabra]|uniref:F-box domain-containing protein n=1 Tax=Stylosanthes scabra TaxID=79078 RepID=A0ABU6R3I9_9FABA|nr:hypothetical protein [Stylosanthes scabra]
MGDIDGWANIHHDILKEIAKHLYSYDDFIQLQLVCKQWSLELPEISTEILWLLIPEQSSSTHIFEDEEIYHLMQLPIADEVPLEIQDLEENGIHHIKLPGNRRNRQLVDFDPEIKRTLTKNINRVKLQRAL